MHCVTKKSHYVLDMENHLQEFNYFYLCLSLILYSKIVNKMLGNNIF